MGYTPYVKVSGSWHKFTIDYTEVVGAPTALSEFTEDADHRTVTDVQIANWDSGGYTLPIATDLVLGGVKAKAKSAETGEVVVDAAGKLWYAIGGYTLPQADVSNLGGIKAASRSTEDVEVKIDPSTGYLYVPSSTGGLTISDTAPSSPSVGDLWFDSVNLKMMIYYDDGDSSQWVVANPSGEVNVLEGVILSDEGTPLAITDKNITIPLANTTDQDGLISWENNAKINGVNAIADKQGDTYLGIMVAQNNTSYGTKQIRNIVASTSDPSGGSNGDVWIKYTA